MNNKHPSHWSVGIVGGGVVGSALAAAFRFNGTGEVRAYDTDPARRTHEFMSDVVCESDVVFVCLPTPGGPDGRLNVVAVEEFFQKVGAAGEKDRLYVLKSTVPVGTTRRLAGRYGLTNLVHSPEFLTARTAETDAKFPGSHIVGFPNGAPDGWSDHPAVRFNQVRFRNPTTVMSSDESEAVKLAQNAYFSVKVAWFNELKRFCDAAGLNWLTVRCGLLLDGRVGPYHTQVPGPDGLPGFGGACLPKDAAEFGAAVESVTDKPTYWAAVTRAALQRNELWDRSNR